MKLFLALCVLFALALCQVNANCSGDCPDTEEVVWAVGGGTCHVFRNNCYFVQANCVRKPPLTIATKEECQKLCATICPQVYQPVQGTYRGKTRTFGNQCMKNAHICSTGETYL